MLEVEDWTQLGQNKRRLTPKKLTSDGQNGKDHSITISTKLTPSTRPPEPEVEDSFMPPNSHLFPTRARSSSSPTTRPSSLSRLLAQAPFALEGSTDTATEKPSPPPDSETPTVGISPAVKPPSQLFVSTANATISDNVNTSTAHGNTNSVNHTSPNTPLRPGSRLSDVSRFSVSRIPALASQTKATATTALSDQVLSTSPENNPFRSPITPSPDESIPEVIFNNTNHRRRSTSYQTARTSPLVPSSAQGTVAPSRPSLNATATLVNLANSWKLSLGRKKAEVAIGKLTPPVESSADTTNAHVNSELQGDGSVDGASARDLLKRF
jgi:autophagy-related protein 11